MTGHTIMPMRAAIWQHKGRPDTVCIYDARGREVISWAGFDGVPGTKAAIRDRAKFVARACNSHAPMLDVLERLFERGDVTLMLAGNPTASAELEADARAAIATAKGEQP